MVFGSWFVIGREGKSLGKNEGFLLPGMGEGLLLFIVFGEAVNDYLPPLPPCPPQ